MAPFGWRVVLLRIALDSLDLGLAFVAGLWLDNDMNNTTAAQFEAIKTAAAAQCEPAPRLPAMLNREHLGPTYITRQRVTVQRVAVSNADRQREYRRRQGARVGQPPGPLPSAEHGTVSAYKRHLRHSEPPCKACRAAWAEYHRNRQHPDA